MKKQVLRILSLLLLVSSAVLALTVRTVRQERAPAPPAVPSPSAEAAVRSDPPPPAAEPVPEPTEAVPAPTPYRNGKTLYLTFDDGPGEFTESLLNLLDAYDVKVTFFVTDTEPDFEDLIGEEFRRGHSIGLHAWHHVWSEVYASEEAYFEDFRNMQEIIRAQTGEETRIFRFPGGSSNRKTDHVPQMMSHLAQKQTEEGYVYFDWDTDCRDAMEAGTAGEVLTNLRNGAKNCREYTVILCHDVYGHTVEAMKEFIPWAIEEGYEFRPLDPDSPTAHHMIKN